VVAGIASAAATPRTTVVATGLEAPWELASGATFVHRRGSAWTGSFLFGTLRGEQLIRLRVSGSRVTGMQRLYEDRFGRIRNVVEGPSGALYLLTSNRDGRGDPSSGNDRIIRLTPP
jgi:aldose sugar dehydrogenase